jgi:hypothetical protein
MLFRYLLRLHIVAVNKGEFVLHGQDMKLIGADVWDKIWRSSLLKREGQRVMGGGLETWETCLGDTDVSQDIFLIRYLKNRLCVDCPVQGMKWHRDLELSRYTERFSGRHYTPSLNDHRNIRCMHYVRTLRCIVEATILYSVLGDTASERASHLSCNNQNIRIRG